MAAGEAAEPRPDGFSQHPTEAQAASSYSQKTLARPRTSGTVDARPVSSAAVTSGRGQGNPALSEYTCNGQS